MIKKLRLFEIITSSKLFQCSILMVWLMEIIDAHLQAAISIDDGKHLQKCCILRFITSRNWLLRWRKNDLYLYSAIYMAIHERKMSLCMDVTIQRHLKKLEYFLLSLVNFVHTLIFMIHDSECKNLKKLLLEWLHSMS